MKTHITCRSHCRALLASMMVVLSGGTVMAAPAAFAHSPRDRIERYLIASRDREIALARSAAPPSISGHATVMVLSPHGYVTVAKGTNGFVCLVMRSWDNSLKSSNFWNPRIRTPQCLNAAARAVVSRYLTRTDWVIVGASKSQIRSREQAARAAGKLSEPAPGAMCYMMSKRGFIKPGVGAWRPHLMFYFPRAHVPNWGANLPGGPVFEAQRYRKDISLFFVLVPVWSNGTPAPTFK